eukprot:scaffold228_cov312-Pinguiococcus_pyrenoidosus.AAC.63
MDRAATQQMSMKISKIFNNFSTVSNDLGGSGVGFQPTAGPHESGRPWELGGAGIHPGAGGRLAVQRHHPGHRPKVPKRLSSFSAFSSNARQASDVTRASLVRPSVYEDNMVAKWVDEINDRCMEQLGELSKPFKYTVTTFIMQRNGAGVHSSHCCFWDMATDIVAQANWPNDKHRDQVSAVASCGTSRGLRRQQDSDPLFMCPPLFLPGVFSTIAGCT